MIQKLALIAHDHKKDDMVVLAKEFADFLSRCHLVATGTTGGRLHAEVGLDVERMLSGPMGGDLQIGARLAVGEVDAFPGAQPADPSRMTTLGTVQRQPVGFRQRP